MHDPMSQMHIGERRLDELRQEAAVRREVAPAVPGWRRAAGRAMVAAGRRLLAEPAAVPGMAPAGEPCE